MPFSNYDKSRIIIPAGQVSNKFRSSNYTDISNYKYTRNDQTKQKDTGKVSACVFIDVGLMNLISANDKLITEKSYTHVSYNHDTFEVKWLSVPADTKSLFPPVSDLDYFMEFMARKCT